MSGRKTRQRADEVIDLLTSSSESEDANAPSDLSDTPPKKRNLVKIVNTKPSKPAASDSEDESAVSEKEAGSMDESSDSPSVEEEPKPDTKSEQKKQSLEEENDSDSLIEIDGESSDDNIEANESGENQNYEESEESDKEQLRTSKRISEMNKSAQDNDNAEGNSESESSLSENSDASPDDPIDDPNVENSEEEDPDSREESVVQVPNSSPQKKPSKYSSSLDSSPPAKITTKLPSLREKFSFKPSPAVKSTKTFQKDYEHLKKMFPNLAASTIINTLRSRDTLQDVINHLKSIAGKSKSSRGEFPDRSDRGRFVGRLDSLASKPGRIVLSSSPERENTKKEKSAREARDKRLKEKAKAIEAKKKQEKLARKREAEKTLARKKAEKENVVSSKVVIDSESKSIKDRFLNRYSKTAIISDEEGEEEEDDGDESIEEIDSDDSVEEVINVSNRRSVKRRYEDDDDYNPARIKKPKKKTIDRAARADKRAAFLEDDDFKLPEFELDEDRNLKMPARIVKLLNNADIRDIIDLSSMKPEQASIVIKNRPYKNITEIRNLNLVLADKPVRYGKKPIDRFIETITEKLTAYEAIDVLLKQCFQYSKSITNEIRKWGVNLKGKNMNGELSILDVEGIDDSSDESSDEDDDDLDEPVVKKQTARRKIKIDGSEDDDDFRVNGKKKIYRSRIDNSLVKDKVGFFKKKPSLMPDDVQLKDYQQVGINWINVLFQKQLSCILADEMGLGKTAQVIAFLSHLKKKGYKGPHLIVVPSSTLENWLREFERFSPSLNVIPYYGSIDEREEIRYVLMEEDFDVVVTTYNLTMGKLDAPFLQSMDFNVIVYDEGHMLKNAMSDRYRKLTKIRANFRMILTGTPLQNNLKELISLLDFILPEIFDPKLEKLGLLFDQKATTKVENEKIEGEQYNPLMSEQAISKAKVMMSPFVLRRTKAQVMKELPEKHTSIEYCEMNPSQKKLYDEELVAIDKFRQERERRKLLTDAEVKKLPKLEKKSTNILMELRKICMHPLLFRQHYTDSMLKVMSKIIMENPEFADSRRDYIIEDMKVMSDFELSQLCHTYPAELGKFVLKQTIYEDSGKVKVLVKMLTDIVARKEKVLIFSLFTQTLDILEKVLSVHNWKFLRLDGSTDVSTRQTMIDKFYDDKTIPVFLLSTKAGGFGINLVCASNVIIYDQSLNPHDDKQAEDRAHRVGQTKEVHVTRLITKGSVEENILHMAFNKLQLDNSIMAQSTEDILLKTVEDLLVAKKNNPEEKVIKVEEDDAENNENVFEADDALDVITNAVEDELNEPIEIELPSSEDDVADGTRRKRHRHKINYSEGGPNAVDREFLVSDDEGGKQKSKKAKTSNTETVTDNGDNTIVKTNKNEYQNEDEDRDQSFQPEDDDDDDVDEVVNVNSNGNSMTINLSRPVENVTTNTITHSPKIVDGKFVTNERIVGLSDDIFKFNKLISKPNLVQVTPSNYVNGPTRSIYVNILPKETLQPPLTSINQIVAETPFYQDGSKIAANIVHEVKTPVINVEPEIQASASIISGMTKVEPVIKEYVPILQAQSAADVKLVIKETKSIESGPLTNEGIISDTKPEKS